MYPLKFKNRSIMLTDFSHSSTLSISLFLFPLSVASLTLSHTHSLPPPPLSTLFHVSLRNFAKKKKGKKTKTKTKVLEGTTISCRSQNAVQSLINTIIDSTGRLRERE